MRKTKLFLCAHLNRTNAQNLNCLGLALHLDTRKYDVRAMVYDKGDFDLPPLPGIRLWKCRWPYKACRYWYILKAAATCDLLYLPKRDAVPYTSFLLKLFRTRSFLTVEGVITGERFEKIIRQLGSEEKTRRSFNFTDYSFSISRFMADYNFKRLGIRSDGILHLGIVSEPFRNTVGRGENMRNVVFIGNDIAGKGIGDYLDAAAEFPELTFHVIGGNGRFDLEGETARRSLSNVVYHGNLSHVQLCGVLKEMDILYLPSRSEGFPKVVLECAAAGIPSILYGDYGADEWLKHGINGWVVDTPQEARSVIAELMRFPGTLGRMASECVALAEHYDWKNRNADWEKAIEGIMKSSRKRSHN